MAHRVTLAIAVAVALVLAAGCTSKPAPDASPTASRSFSFQAGAEGLGDSYFPDAGNGGYDVGNYALNLRYDPATDRLSGTAVITAKATQDLSQFNLDFRGLTTERVTVDGTGAKAAQDGDELVVTPAAGLPKDAQFTVEVRYAGVPKAYEEPGLGQIGFLHTDDGAVAIGQPQVAASWYPVNDHPRDKATYTVAIAAPDGLSALSNGVLKEKKSADGYTTWTWSETKPMASYLATVVIGQYRLKESTHDGKPVVLAVDTSLSTQIDTQLARTPEIVDFLESKFGPYPFDAIGGIVVDDRRIRFALENQSRPIYSFAFFDPPGTDGTGVIVHELAHQWYGDSVSVNEWKDIWLNEGFATYAEWLWTEEQKQETAQQIFDRLLLAHPEHDVERDHRRPRRGGSVRLRWRLPAGWHDPARVAGHGRRRRLLQDPSGLGGGEARRERHHHGLHRGRRANLGQTARRSVPGLALRQGTATAPDWLTRHPWHALMVALRRHRCRGTVPSRHRIRPVSLKLRLST